ncbi:sensor histidine kinase [Caulobacter sp. 17J80-11]|uniref:sensor histidine kinase n=1 Tax=Caulobacter sp. 17J80-11 TaxID=2763502 RepID=UPI0016534A22|nr:ATP-binding protein [Caulobacter sp. 17J80-11]MBC6981346.1 DUF4118 domain-containing protein [Caulobacter sp. 17J80-11]
MSRSNRRAIQVVTAALRQARRAYEAPAWLRNLATVGIVVATGLVHYVLRGPLLGHPFLLFFPAIILCGFLFGRGAGLLATVISVVLALRFVPPLQSFAILREQVFAVTTFAVTGAACALVLDALHGAATAATEREQALARSLAALAQSERQKQRLLDELGHRVRNDLAALAGSLALAARRNPSAAGALTAAANQVRVLGRVHARLSQAGDEIVVDSADFLTALGQDLAAMPLGEARVRISVEAARVALPLDAATALGLIVNELVTNAAKYAFPQGEGAVTITLRAGDNGCVLAVADDGVGLGGGAIRGTGQGTRIVDGLAAQLGGTFDRRDGAVGTVATVAFPVPGASPLAQDAADR